MKQQKLIFLLLVITVLLIIALSTGVGYATTIGNSIKISDNIQARPEYSDFRVGFTGRTSYYGTGKAILKTTGPTTGKMDITNLSKVGDYVIGVFNIKNTSHELSAILTKTHTNSNPEYFKVTAEFAEDTLIPRNGETELRIKVELIKLPINKVETTKICVKITANPIECKY